MKAAQLGTDPTLNSRSFDTPVGLKVGCCTNAVVFTRTYALKSRILEQRVTRTHFSRYGNNSLVH